MMKRVGKLAVILMLVAFIGMFGVTTVFANGDSEAEYPTKTITVIVSFPAGGLADIIARTIAQEYEEELGVPVQVINKPGGAMIPGTMALLEEPADGYTMIFGAAPNLLTLPYINNAPYTHEDLELLFLTGVQKNVLYVAADSPIQDLGDFVDAAKADKLIVATNALGAPPTLSMAQFAKSVGIEVEYLSEGTVPKAMVAVIGGHADAAVGQLTQLEQYPDEIRALAILDETGHERLPGVPTAKEALPGMDVVATSWVRSGFAVKKGTPQEIIDILVAVAEKRLNNDVFKDKLNATGNIHEYTGYEEANAAYLDGVAFYQPLIDELGLRKE